MEYTIVKSGSRYKLTLIGDHPQVHVVEMKPVGLEPLLRQNCWLVLLVAVWSGPDRKALELILDPTVAWPTWINIAVRLFDEEGEASTWCPTITTVTSSPIWVFMKGGRPLGHLVGIRTAKQLCRWLESTAQSGVPSDVSEAPGGTNQGEEEA